MADSLANIDISNCNALTYLSFGGIFTNLDLSDCSALAYLNCRSNYLTNLDVSYCSSLKELKCENNMVLSSLNVSGATALEILDCSDNALKTLNLSYNPILKEIDCSDNLLECLNLKNGNNISISKINTEDNYNLLCIDVDDSTYCTNNPTWNKGVESWTHFSEDCGNSCSHSGVNEKPFEQSIIVYPNPNNGNFNVKVSFEKQSDISIFITNTLGEVVYSGFEYSQSKQVICIDLDLADGVYYARVQSSDGSELFPIIVAK